MNILRIPGAKINRNDFLRESFANWYGHDTDEPARIIVSPLEIIPIAEIERQARKVIRGHTTKVTTLSTLTGLPGGLAMLASIPADLVNYYYHVVTVGQKLAYLYGYPDLLDAEGGITDDGMLVLTVFIGAMNSVEEANAVVTELTAEVMMVSTQFADKTATKVARNILSKQVIGQSVEVIAKRLGLEISARTGGRALAKAVPLLSGAISGALTFQSYSKQTRRLHRLLRSRVQNNPGL